MDSLIWKTIPPHVPQWEITWYTVGHAFFSTYAIYLLLLANLQLKIKSFLALLIILSPMLQSVIFHQKYTESFRWSRELWESCLLITFQWSAVYDLRVFLRPCAQIYLTTSNITNTGIDTRIKYSYYWKKIHTSCKGWKQRPMLTSRTWDTTTTYFDVACVNKYQFLAI